MVLVPETFFEDDFSTDEEDDVIIIFMFSFHTYFNENLLFYYL